MRYRPNQAAPDQPVPFPFLGPKRIRKILAGLAASAAGLVPVMLVSAPAQAAPIDLLTISDAAAWEGGDLVFTVTYTGTAAEDFTFSTAGVSATTVTDYTATPTSPYFGAGTQTISFGASSTNTPSKATVTVHAEDDGDSPASDETFELRAVTDGGVPATVVKGTGSIWNLDTDNDIVLSGETTVAETATGGTQKSVTVTATQTNPQQHDVVIPVRTADWADGTDYVTDIATPSGGNNRDYTALPSDAKIVIPANETVGTTTVQLWDDTADEEDKQTFTVEEDSNRDTLGGAVVSTQNAVNITITDDDATPTVSIGNAATVKEGASLTFPVTLSGPSEKGASGVTADLALVGAARGTALAATRGTSGQAAAPGSEVDFVWGAAGVLAADTKQQITVPRYARTTNVMVTTTGNPSATFEGPENVTATLSNPGDITLGTAVTANGVITDAEAGQTLQWSAEDPFVGGNVDFPEGNAGPVDQKIYLKFTTGTLGTTLNYKFVDGTAKNGSDFVGKDGSIAVPAYDSGHPSAGIVSIPVSIIGDRVDEADPEAFKLVVTDPNSVTNAANIGEVSFTISDDDAAPSWSTQDVTVAKEGDTGTTVARIPITLSSPVGSDATFTAGFTTGSAVDLGSTPGANDYDEPTTLTTTIKAGESKGYFEVPINGDTVFEKDESFTVTFTPPGGVIDNSSPDIVPSSRVTIVNDDAAPKLTFTSFSGAEGGTVTVNGTIVGAAQAAYTLGFSTAGTGTNPATPGTDYTNPANLANTTVTVTSGFTGSLANLATPFNGLTFTLANDNVDEAVESFAVNVAESTSTLQGFSPSVATVKIADDPLDLPPAVSIGDVSIGEWEKTVDVPVKLTFGGDNDATSTQQTVTVPFWTVDGSAKSGSDYKWTKSTLEIKPGATTANINIPVIDDKTKESNEDFFVKLGTPGPTGATLTKDSAQVIVKDNDAAGEEPGEEPNEPGAPTITAPAKVVGAVAVPIRGQAPAGATVELWGAPMGATKVALKYITSVKADEDGKYAFSRWIGQGYRFATQANDLTSDEVQVLVQQSPAFTATSPSRGRLALTVQGNPKGAKQAVIVQRLVSGKWVNTTWRGTTASNGQWKSTVNAAAGSSHTLRAFVAGNTPTGLQPGYSVARKVTIRK